MFASAFAARPTFPRRCPVTVRATSGFWPSLVIAPVTACVAMCPRSWLGLRPTLRATAAIVASEVTICRTVVGFVAWLCTCTPLPESGCPR